MSQLVGEEVETYVASTLNQALFVLELGGGTGITTLAILRAGESVNVVSVDCEATMQNQAKQSLQKWIEQGQLNFDARDAYVLKNSATAALILALKK